MSSSKKTFIILAFIIILGSFFRFYNLGEKSFMADEFLVVNTAYGYLQTGQWKRWDFNFNRLAEDKPYFKTFFDFDFFGGGEKTYTRAWIYNWQISQTLKIFPAEKEFSFRIISVLWGLASLLIIYWTTFKMTGNKVIALAGSFLLTASIASIEFSRLARMYAMFLPIFGIFSYFVFQLIESEKKWGWKALEKAREKTGMNFFYFLPAVILGLLSMHIHLLTVNIIPIVLVYFVVMAFWQYRAEKNILNRYSFYFLLAFSVLATSFVFFGQTGIWASFLTPNNHFSYIEKVLSDYSSGVLATGLTLLGTAYFWRKKNKGGMFAMVSFWTILVFAVFLWNRNAGEQYIYFSKFFQVILLGGGIYAISDYLKTNFRQNGKRIFWIAILALLVLLPRWEYFFQEDNTYKQTSRSENPDYRKVFDYFLDKKAEGDVLVTRGFRNYYFRGAEVSLFTFGGERAFGEEKKLTVKEWGEIMDAYPCGWIIWSDNDEIFISKAAKKYIENNTEKISHSRVRGNISVNHWCRE